MSMNTASNTSRKLFASSEPFDCQECHYQGDALRASTGYEPPAAGSSFLDAALVADTEALAREQLGDQYDAAYAVP